MGDIYEKVKESRTALEKLLDFIPGWSGYQERQTRRKADQLLRQTLAGREVGRPAPAARCGAERVDQPRSDGFGG